MGNVAVAVVTVDTPAAGIRVVTMAERDHCNTFSPALMTGLTATFRELARDPDIRVVILTGYDTYFCCGGTREELLALHGGTRTFAEQNLYRLLLDFELPVISAMQGHAVGAGLAFGCYADMILMAEESMYAASFMKYGFTPGFGATRVIPDRLGTVGAEMLLTARNYQGSELKRRGIAPQIVRRSEVLPVAMANAREIADKPALSLRLLKAQLTKPLREALPRIIEDELAMHRQTFGREEVRERIERNF